MFRARVGGHWHTSNTFKFRSLHHCRTSFYLTPRIRSYPRSSASLLKHWDCSASVLFWEVKSCWVYVLFLLPQHSSDLSSHNSHQVFIISSLYTGYQIISQTDSRHEAVGGEQFRPHYTPALKTLCIVYIWHDNTILEPQSSDLFLLSY